MVSKNDPVVNEPMIGTKDMASMKKQIFRGIIYRTIALVVFIVAVVLFFSDNFISVPAISAAIILYVDSIGGISLAGRMAKPLSSALKVLAATVFFGMLAMTQQAYPVAAGLAPYIFIAGGIWSVHCISKAYSEFTGVVTRALLIGAAGVIYYSVFTAVTAPMLSQMTLVALVGLVSGAVFSFLGILKKHSNAQIAYIGGLFAKIESPVVVCVAVAAIMTYILFIRQSLAVLGFFGMTVIEWAALCGIVLFLAIKLRAIMPKSDVQKFGDLHKAACSLGDDKGELKNAAAKVEEFIRDGKKDGLVALIATALVSNEVPVDRVQSVISRIVDHEDEKEPPAMFKWAMGNVNDGNRRKRSKAVDEMMAAAVAAIGDARGPTGIPKGTAPGEPGQAKVAE